MGLNRVRGDLCSIATAIVLIKIGGEKRKRETPWVRVAQLVRRGRLRTGNGETRSVSTRIRYRTRSGRRVAA